jgi:hypothetical protein
MQKLSHKSMIILHKSCSALNKETNKISFLFFDFSVNLYGFYKMQAKHKSKEESIGTQVPSKSFSFTEIPSGQKLSQISPRWWRRARRRWGGAGERQQTAHPCDWAHLRSIGVLGEHGDVAGERQRRSSGSTAAVAQCLARWGVVLGKVRRRELQCDLREGLRGSDGTGIERGRELVGGCNGGRDGTRCSRARKGGEFN